MQQRKTTGFSLVELLVVMVVLGIIMAIGVPGYRQYMQRANRTDATTTLLRIAAAQERFYIQNGTYASNAQLAPAPPAGLGIAGTERGYYNLVIAPGPGGLATGYTAWALIKAGEAQADDVNCAGFSINERGQRTAVDSGGGDRTDDCWR